MKKCTRCKETKEFEEFNKNQSTPTGYQHECRPCHRARASEYVDIARAHLAEQAVPEEDVIHTATRLTAESMDVIDYLEWLAKWTTHDPETDCQTWNGTKVNSYGVFNAPMPTTPGTTYPIRSHRLSFALANGIDALPEFDEDKMTLDHQCGVRSCVNPLHLQVMTLAENVSLKGQERVGKKFSDLKPVATWTEDGEFVAY